jgi:transposase
MPWKEISIMSSRKEFVLLAKQEGANIRTLCRQFGISPKTGYKLINRYTALGDAGLLDRSRQPKTSPRRTSTTLETAVLTLRDQHPAWGGRKLAARLQALG